jgi:hypothetical protein
VEGTRGRLGKREKRGLLEKENKMMSRKCKRGTEEGEKGRDEGK